MYCHYYYWILCGIYCTTLALLKCSFPFHNFSSHARQTVFGFLSCPYTRLFVSFEFRRGNFCQEHRDKTEVPDPLVVEDLISDKLKNRRKLARPCEFSLICQLSVTFSSFVCCQLNPSRNMECDPWTPDFKTCLQLILNLSRRRALQILPSYSRTILSPIVITIRPLL